ncbi:MAG: glycoside hydrolase family 16 protein [Ferruginibacter sp.]
MKQIILSAVSILTVCIANAQKDAISFFEEFNDATSKNFRYGSTGSKADFKWKMGVPSLTEPGSKVLSFKIDPQDSVGAGRGPEIISKYYTHFGSYSARLKVPKVKDVQPNVGAVVGYFTYNVDSIPGLSEIDFEWLIADPSIIYIGTWTGHYGELKRIGRTINLAKGTILSTIYKENYNGTSTPLSGMQNLPETIPVIEGYDASSKFYTYDSIGIKTASVGG